MDKEFLGLGIVFKGIDKGLDKSLDSAAMGFEKTTQAITHLEKAADAGGKGGGMFNGLIEGMKLLSIGRIGSTLDAMSQGIAGTDKTFNHLSITLSNVKGKFSQVFDPKSANALNSALVQTIASTGISADEAQKLAFGMTDFGQSAQQAANVLPFMGQMVGLLGVDAGKVAAMFGQGLATLRATPEQMKDLVKETVKMGKAYNLTDTVSALPDLFESVTKNAARFGLVSADAAIRTTMGLSGIVAGFRKVGKSQQEAISSTVGFNNKLGEMENSIRDMEVGLGPMDQSVIDLAQALSLAGMTDPFAVIKAGFKDPAGLIKTIGDQIAGMDSFTQQGVTQRLRRIFGDDVTNLLSTYRDDVSGAVKAAEKQGSALGTSDQEFKKTTNAMLGTLGVQEKLYQTSKDLLAATLDFATSSQVLAGLANESKAFGELGKMIADNDSWLGKIIRTLDIFKKTGLAGLFGSKDMSMLSVVSGMLGSLIFPLTSLLGLFTMFKGPAKALGSLLLSPFKGLFSIISMVLKPFAALGGFLLRITGLSKVAAGSVSMMGKAWAGLRGMLGAVGQGVMNFAKTLAGPFINVFKSVGSFIGNLVSGPLKFLGAAFRAIGSFAWSLISGPFKLLGTAFKAIGSFAWNLISGPFKMLGSLLGSLGSGFRAVGGFVWKLISGPFKMLGSFFSGFMGVLRTAGGFIMNLISGPFKFLGSLLSATGTGFRMLGSMIMNLVSGPLKFIGSLLSGVGASFRMLGSFVWSLISGPFKLLGSALRMMGPLFSSIGSFIWTLISGPFKMLGSAIQWAAGMFGPLLTVFKSLGMGMLRLMGAPVKLLVSGLSSVIGWAVRLAAVIMGPVIEAIVAMGAALLANPVGLAIAAVVALGAAIAATIYYWDDISAAVAEFVDWFSATFPQTTAVILKAWDAVKKATLALMNYWGNVFTLGWEALKGICRAGFQFISDLIESFKASGFSGVWELLKQKASEAWDAIVAKVMEAKGKIMEFVAGIPASISAAWAGVGTFLSGAVASLKDALKKVLDIEGLMKAFSEGGGTGAFDFLVTAASNALARILKIFQDGWASIKMPDFASSIGSFFGMGGGAPADKNAMVPPGTVGFAEAQAKFMRDKGIPEADIQKTLAAKANPAVTAQTEQPGAPVRSRRALDIQFEKKNSSADVNFQALINEIFDLKKTLVEALQQLADRDVKVNITGDIRKFIKAVKDDSNDYAGSTGLGVAANP